MVTYIQREETQSSPLSGSSDNDTLEKEPMGWVLLKIQFIIHSSFRHTFKNFQSQSFRPEAACISRAFLFCLLFDKHLLEILALEELTV